MDRLSNVFFNICGKMVMKVLLFQMSHLCEIIEFEFLHFFNVDQTHLKVYNQFEVIFVFFSRDVVLIFKTVFCKEKVKKCCLMIALE